MATKKTTTRKAAASEKKVTPAKKTAPRKPRVTKNVEADQPAPEKTTTRAASPSVNVLSEKIRNPKLLIGLGVVILVIALLYMLRSQFIVAMVNGRPISRSAFNTQLEQQSGKEVLNSLITKSLIEQEADKRHVSVPQSEVDSDTKKIEQQLSAQGQNLDQALAARGMTRSQFTDQLRLQKLVEKLLGNNIKVSDKEVQDYIDQHKDQLGDTSNMDQLKAQVRAQLEQDKLSSQAQQLIAKLQKQANITYFINF